MVMAEIRAQKENCIQHLKTLKNKGKTYGAFDELRTMLQAEAASKGLSNKEIELITQIIMKNDLGSVKLVSLMKCLTPMGKMPENPVKSLITWCMGHINDLALTLSTIIIQWIVGLHQYQLVEREVINTYYDVFFYVMLKKEKLERHLAYLIYVLTKPEDVTRRTVSRLLAHKLKYSKPQKHIIALLSLFKSYKPELVPEKIPSMNIESVWKPIPEVLRIQFKEASDRAENGGRRDIKQIFNWNTLETRKSRKSAKPLLPSVGYFQIGSNIFKEQDMKSIFDVTSFEELGKYQQSVELPCNAVSLLSNVAGYHLLTYTDLRYQSRFVYNLYNTLTRAFMLENGKFSSEDMEKLLDMTVEFSRYMQQGLLVVNLFFDEYMSLRTGEHELKLLALLEWMVSLSIDELRERVVDHIKSIYYTSGLEMQCAIINTLKKLITNLFVHQEFAESAQNTPAPFLGQVPSDSLEDIHPILVDFARDLITWGLNVHSYDSTLLVAGLCFYEQISLLEERSKEPFFSVAPAALIYGSFVTKSCAILSQVCALLNSYHERTLKLNVSRTRQLYKKVDNIISGYASDFVTALWSNEPFSKHEQIYFLKNFPKRVLDELNECELDEMLNICNHYAVLPYRSTLSSTRLHIRNTPEDCFNVAKCYYPAVSDFLSIHLNLDEAENEESD